MTRIRTRINTKGRCRVASRPRWHAHHLNDLMRVKSMVSNPRIEYKSEVSNLVKELAQFIIIYENPESLGN